MDFYLIMLGFFIIVYGIGISIGYLMVRKYLRFIKEQAVKRGGHIKARYRLFIPQGKSRALPSLVLSYRDIEFSITPMLDTWRNYFVIEFNLPFRAFYNIHLCKKKIPRWEKILGKEITKTGREVIKTENPVFDDEYILESNEEKVATHLFNSEVQETLLKFNFNGSIKIFQNKFSLISPKMPLEENRLEEILKIARLFCDCLIFLH